MIRRAAVVALFAVAAVASGVSAARAQVTVPSDRWLQADFEGDPYAATLAAETGRADGDGEAVLHVHCAGPDLVLSLIARRELYRPLGPLPDFAGGAAGESVMRIDVGGELIIAPGTRVTGGMSQDRLLAQSSLAVASEEARRFRGAERYRIAVDGFLMVFEFSGVGAAAAIDHAMGQC